MIWFASDFHYGHKNICYGTSQWSDKEESARDFNTLEEMNNAIVKSINKSVEPDDTLYFLGDWSFGGINNIFTFWLEIECLNIYFIPGNHDHHIKKNKVFPDNVYAQRAGDIFNILPELLTISIDKQQFVLCHFPIEEWENMEKGTIHIHGHSHHKVDDSINNTEYKRIDVGWTPEKAVYSIDEIKEIMKSRKNKSHGNIHDKNT